MTYNEDPIIDRAAEDEVEVKDEDPYCDNDYWKETMKTLDQELTETLKQTEQEAKYMSLEDLLHD